ERNSPESAGSDPSALSSNIRSVPPAFGLFRALGFPVHHVAVREQAHCGSCGKVKPPRNCKIHIRITRNVNGRVAGRLRLPAIATVVDYLKMTPLGAWQGC